MVVPGNVVDLAPPIVLDDCMVAVDMPEVSSGSG